MVAEIFQRFVQESPVAVMVRATLENAFAGPALDALFAQTAEQQYTRTLLFSTVVELMTTVVLRQEQSIHAAFQRRREQVAVGISSLYEKLGRMETKVSEALVAHSVAQVAPVLQEVEPVAHAVLAGYEVRILDGQGNRASSAGKTEELGQVGNGPAGLFALDFQRAFPRIPPQQRERQPVQERHILCRRPIIEPPGVFPKHHI